MSATTTQSTQPFDADNFMLGTKVITYALQALGAGLALAIAWSCSTLVMGIVMFIIMSLVMMLLMAIAQGVLMFKLGCENVESLGATVGGAAARVTGMFTRKAAA